jgi:hypothetical protein
LNKAHKETLQSKEASLLKKAVCNVITKQILVLINKFNFMEKLQKLSKDEMKNVTGGKLAYCVYVLNGVATGGYMAPGYGQDFADGICEADPTCSDVDCNG